MPFIDRAAGNRLRRLRELETGMSPEALADEIARWATGHDDWRSGTIDAYTIRRAERGLVPSIRTRFVLTRFFDVEPGTIWNEDAWVKVEPAAVAS